MKKFIVVLMVFAVAVTLNQSAFSFQPQEPEEAVPVPAYEVVWLAGLSSSQKAEVVEINNANKIVGRSENAMGWWRAVSWELDGSVTELTNMPADAIGMGGSVNNAGQIVGYHGTFEAMLWENGNVTELGPFFGGSSQTLAYNINDAGDIVGCGKSTGWNAYLYSDGSSSMLPGLGGSYACAKDINESGIIVGSAKPANASYTAVIWENGAIAALPSSGTGSHWAQAINDLGEVVGGFDFDGPFVEHAVLWTNGNLVDLSPDSDDSGAFDINNHGNIVGHISQRAYLWKNGVGLDLNTLIGPQQPNVVLKFAKSINDAGYIVGDGFGPVGYQAFLLVPFRLLKADPLEIR